MSEKKKLEKLEPSLGLPNAEDAPPAYSDYDPASLTVTLEGNTHKLEVPEPVNIFGDKYMTKRVTGFTITENQGFFSDDFGVVLDEDDKALLRYTIKAWSLTDRTTVSDGSGANIVAGLRQDKALFNWSDRRYILDPSMENTRVQLREQSKSFSGYDVFVLDKPVPFDNAKKEFDNAKKNGKPLFSFREKGLLNCRISMTDAEGRLVGIVKQRIGWASGSFSIILAPNIDAMVALCSVIMIYQIQKDAWEEAERNSVSKPVPKW